MNMKFKIAFFDCDGVLSLGNTWLELHKSVGISAEKNFQWRSQFYKGEITWEQWFENIEPYYRQSNLRRKDFSRVLNKILINQEANKLFKGLKKFGMKTAIISGSVDQHVERISKHLGTDMWRANTSIKYDENGFFERFVNVSDELQAKEIFIKEICSGFKVKPTETFFVGDSINDSAAFRLTQHGILYKNIGRPEDIELEKYAWRKIDNLIQILSISNER